MDLCQQEGDCRFNVSTKVTTDKGYCDIPDSDELALKEAVALVGPVAVGVDATHEDLQFYSQGKNHYVH